MRLSQLKRLDEVVEGQREGPEFRAEWDRGEIARGIAAVLVRYRAAHALSQRDLARSVGMAAAIARLERGERQPSFDTLIRLTATTGLEFHFDVIHGAVRMAS